MSETYSGVSSIRTFNRESPFFESFKEKVNLNLVAYYWHFAANRWLGKERKK